MSESTTPERRRRRDASAEAARYRRRLRETEAKLREWQEAGIRRYIADHGIDPEAIFQRHDLDTFVRGNGGVNKERLDHALTEAKAAGWGMSEQARRLLLGI